MNGRERMLLALNRREPDLVPVWEMAYNEPSIIGIGRHFVAADQLPPDKPVLDMDGAEKLKLIGTLLAFVRGLDLDGVTAVLLAPRTRIDASHMRDALGVVYHMSDVGEPYPVDGPIREASDLRGFKMRPPEPADYLMLDVLRGNFPDRCVAMHMPGPFKLSWTLRGSMEKLLMDYVLDPGLARDLADLTTEHCLETLAEGVKRGADFIILEGDLAHNPSPLMSPRHYREFIKPWHAKLCAEAHRLGIKICKHSDGNLKPLVPDLLDAGFDGIHPIQPQCMDIGEIKREFGDRACVLGNIDCSFLLVFGSPAEVRDNVRETIKVAAPGGGYIISSSNSIHPGVKPENYLAMVAAAREFGNYPIVD